MFTGIIEAFGKVDSVEKGGANSTYWISSPISEQLKIDQSVSHNGVCLTVEEVTGGRHRVTAIDETLKKTNLGAWQPGVLVNLERSMTLNGRIDGHMVQGHVDATAICVSKIDVKGSWEFKFQFPETYSS